MNPKNSITNKMNITYEVGEKFKESTFPIYTLNINGKPSPFLLKVVPFTGRHIESYKNQYEKEISYLKQASELRVSPKLIHDEIITRVDLKTNNEYELGILIMEKYGEGTLTELYNNLIREGKIEKYRTNIGLQIKSILDKLYKNNISHNDLHSDNFLYHYDKSKDKYTIKIIDFDQATGMKHIDYRGKEVKRKQVFNIEILNTDNFLKTKNIFNKTRQLIRNNRKNTQGKKSRILKV